MEDVVAQGAKFEPPDVIKPPEPGGEEPQEVQDPRAAEAEAEGDVPKKIKEADHPVGEVEIQPPKVEGQNNDKEDSIEDEKGATYSTDQLQFMMGVSLVVGFVFMLLVDQCGGGHSHSHVSGG
jgi:hypothetical protein